MRRYLFSLYTWQRPFILFLIKKFCPDGRKYCQLKQTSIDIQQIISYNLHHWGLLQLIVQEIKRPKHSHHSLSLSYLLTLGIKTQTTVFLHWSYILPVDQCASRGAPRSSSQTTIFKQQQCKEKINPAHHLEKLFLIFFLKTKDLAPLAWLFLNTGLGTLCAGLMSSYFRWCRFFSLRTLHIVCKTQSFSIRRFT